MPAGLCAVLWLEGPCTMASAAADTASVLRLAFVSAAAGSSQLAHVRVRGGTLLSKVQSGIGVGGVGGAAVPCYWRRLAPQQTVRQSGGVS